MIKKWLMKLFKIDECKECIFDNHVVYINKEGHGSGELYINGKRVYGIKNVQIDATTNTDKINYLRLVVDVTSDFRMEE